jgi:dienelactone hydrolase
MTRFIVLIAALLQAPMLAAEIQSTEVKYEADGVTMLGYIAWDDSIEGQRPGVIVVHEWWGHTEYPRGRARELAALGYTAMSVDMYGEGTTAEHPDDAQKFMNEVLANLPGGRARFDAALATLRQHKTVDPEKVAAIGYCFGGGVVLHMALHGAELDAVASFHGSLPPGIIPETFDGPIGPRIVIYNGEDDELVPSNLLADFSEKLEQANADFQVIQLPGAKHGFSNLEATANGKEFGLPLEYNALADEASWDHMRLLFNDEFKD